MPKLKPNAVPAYRLHRQSGQAIVTLSGRDILLGAFDSPASRAAYDRAVAEWIGNGRRWPGAGADLSVAEMIVRYWEHARSYYGTSGELDNIKYALRPLKKLYADTSAATFGPLALKTIRESLIRENLSRGYINACIGRVKQVFKWAVSEEMVPATVFEGLRTVAGLRVGRTEARETEPVKPVADHVIDATLPHLSSTVRAMVELQLLTGARPGEICQIRTGDIDITGTVWTFTPAKHKTAYHGHARTVYIGPKAQEVLRPFLRLDTQAYVFSPAEADVEWRAAKRLARKTKVPPSQILRAEQTRDRDRKRPPGDRYYVTAYRRAVARACDAAFPPPEHLSPGVAADGKRESKQAWRRRLTTAEKAELRTWRKAHRWHPHRLRHSAATRLRKEYGLEAAQVILGHQTLTVTQVYAEKNVAKAKEVMGQVG